MLFGDPPPDRQGYIKKLNLQKNGVMISEECKDLIFSMLEPDLEERIDWIDIYRHPLL